MTDIRNKRTLVTGAAMGMGLLMAEKFAQHGARVAMVDINEPALEEAAEQLRAKGLDVEPFVCDLAERKHIVALREEVLDRLGRIDILVNNAGVVAGGHYEDIAPELDDLMLRVNVDAVHWMTKEFMGDLKAGRDCHIVNMASAAGMLGVPDQAVYCASKWFVIGLSEAIRQEFRDQGISHIGISIICPSLVNTGMFDGAQEPILSPILDPDFVADKVIEAVENDELYVREPFMVKLTPLLRATLPTGVLDTMLEKFGVTKLMKGHRGRE
ncbi:SDR family NAD(P)-dependent oxidoreductase [Persicimonas caeni]|uniref:SDR family NAD(P)-dependent oxidoreductase n=1 Tax=Persicimonas caeni TaxID=2292766 RepID=A0A4Y6PPU4_PERCE|nr:SDR family NAD(P)-dependent oxidoreductase [Persicimonas caeni]QDG50334.1 SDR family NAD(P)-dependent oxidoreductase [Persicimonas caeni]QED31555.1 SDR family NAD(P)-dependent oxidoreductase [Persicimonas caeni]